MPKKLRSRPTKLKLQPGAKVRVALYLRRSTDEQNQPFTIGAQEDNLRVFVTSQPGWEVTAVFQDDISGATRQRTAPG